MVDVVGLRFVTEGEREILNAIQNVDRAQKTLVSSARSLEGAISRGSTSVQNAVAAYLALERAGMSYDDVLKGVAQDQKMAVQTAQQHTNALLGVDRAYKSARDSASAFKDALEAQANSARVAQEWTADLNERMGVTGTKATELGATFALLGTVQDNLDNTARAWTSGLNERLGVTGARATELGATFARLEQVQDNLAASARAWTTELNERLGVTGTRATDLGATFARLDQVQENLAASARRWTAELNERMGVTGARATELGAGFSALEARQQEVIQSYARLRAASNPAIAAQQRMKQVHDTVRAALVAEIITRDQAAQALREYRAVAATTNGVIQDSTRGQSRLGVAFQQTGYQVGDFFVQVQSGTHYMVALGQQLTQLVGTGAALARSTKWIAAFSALGIIVPIVTALAGGFLRARDALDETAKATERFESALKSLDSTVQDWLTTKKAAAAGLTVNEMIGGQSIAEAEAELARAQAVIDRLQGIQAGTQPGMTLRDFSQQAGGVNLAEAQAARDAAQKRVDELRAMMAEVGQQERAEIERQIELLNIRAQYGEDSLEYRQREVELALQAFDEETRARQDIAAGDKEILITRESIRLGLEASAEAREREGDAQRRLLDDQIAAWAAEEEAYAARTNSANERIAQYEQEAALNRAILEHGAESAQVEALRREQAMAAVQAYIQQEGLTGEIAQQLLDAAAAAYDTDAAIAAAAGSAGGLANALRDAVAAMGSLASFSANLDRSLAVAAAKVNALRTGANEAVAGTIAGLRADLDSRIGAASAAGVDRSIVERMFGGERDRIRQLEALENERVRLQDANRSSGRSGSSGGASEKEAASLQSVVAEMEKRIERERELLGLFGDSRREREIALDIEDQLLKSGQTATQEQIAAAAAKIAAEERVNETLRRQQEVISTLASTLENSMTSAFMSIVDGTKTAGDAFRDMAKQIIMELYKVLVVQRLVGSWDSKTGSGSGIVGAVVGAIGRFFADGAAFSNGDVTAFARGAVMANLNRSPGAKVVPFATGGVVGSPMLFPMSGGRTGLMGEAGPEAIMPLKRGSDGKLGVSTNGAAPVVQIINQIPDAQVTRERELQPNGASLERFTVSRAVASGLTTPGGAGRKTAEQTFGLRPRRTTR